MRQEEQFLRTEMILGPSAMEILKNAHVAVVGLGGVGSWCAEALARAGVGSLTLVDHDEVGLSNLNRQAEALHSTVGKPKTEAMAARIRDINPDCRLRPRLLRYASDTRERFFDLPYNYVVDAIDLVSCKLDLIQSSMNRGVPVISALGTGNKLNSEFLQVTDIEKTQGCPLARVVRKELRARGILHHKVVYSPELPHTVSQPETPPPGRRSVPASVMWVPATAGLMLAGEVVLDLTGIRK
ncbi:MAG: tRNA threonylcarbamoyladenosine dehydratase [Intestinimonas sp.]|jgi:tRNA A37 threonylcarbamoyladenosine dehydratase|nr:tRNA threonylcarbamoyladenosine dehydratase [Intestinimonas sp.]